MCEFDPDCTTTTDPLAAALAKSPRERDALLLVTCPVRHHLLAAVYDLPTLGVALCQPAMKARHGSLFQPRAGVDPNRIMHWHPALRALDVLDCTQFGRCRCGTWRYSAQAIRDELARVAAGERDDVGPDAFVKVRADASGQVSRMARDYADQYVMPQGGHSVIGRAPGSPRARRPYMHGSAVGLPGGPTNGRASP